MNNYISEWFLDYERKYAHLLTIIRSPESDDLESISFMGHDMWLDHCNGTRLTLKTTKSYVHGGLRLVNFTLILPLDVENEADLHMNPDLKFDLDTCVFLYSNNIKISYVENGKYVYYDRVKIMRRHTINQIKNYEQNS